MYKLWLTTYAHAYLDFALPLFVVPLPNIMQAKTRFGTFNMARGKEITVTMMAVDLGTVEVATKNTQVALETTKVATKTM
jgi:Fe2+ transport system protein FeoA